MYSAGRYLWRRKRELNEPVLTVPEISIGKISSLHLVSLDVPCLAVPCTTADCKEYSHCHHAKRHCTMYSARTVSQASTTVGCTVYRRYGIPVPLDKAQRALAAISKIQISALHIPPLTGQRPCWTGWLCMARHVWVAGLRVIPSTIRNDVP